MPDENTPQQGTPVTLEAVQKLVTDAIAGAVKPLADSVAQVSGAFQAYQKTNGNMLVRNDYIRKHMSELPEIYAEKMPQTNDAAELSRAEQAIRQQYTKDYGGAVKAGVAPKIPDVGYGNPGGISPSSAVDPSQRPGGPVSAVDKIQSGLKPIV